MIQSRFITLEGIEGSGKSTAQHHVSSVLKEHGRQCVLTFEPGGTLIGQGIRDILLDPGHTVMDPYSELLLYLASRRQHIREVILPALEEGLHVLCDRYEDSSLAYQGHARGLGVERVRRLSREAGIDLLPDLTILLDLDPETGLERARGRPLGGDTRFENERLEFHKAVREGYLLLAEAEAERFRVIDASRELEVVNAQVADCVLRFLGLR